MAGEPVARARFLAPALLAVCGLVVGAGPLLLGPPGGDDAYYHAMRAQQQARCWLRGVPFPRWYPDLNGGLGGPEPRAYPLVPLVVGGALALATGDAVAAISLATALTPVLAGMAAWLVLRRRGPRGLAAVGLAAAWAAAPYLVVALHERAALAECFGLALLPWALHALLPPRPRGAGAVLIGGLAFGALLACQIPLAAMAAVVVGGAHLFAGRERAPLGAAAAGALGAVLSAASWLPNVASLGRMQGSRLTGPGYRWAENLLPAGLRADPVLAGHLAAALAGTALALAVALVWGDRRGRIPAGIGLGLLALSTPLAAPAYGAVPGLASLQFPWRWIGPAACLAVLALAAVERRLARAVGIALFLLPLAVPSYLRWRLPEGAPMRPRDAGAVVARAAVRFGVPPILPSLPAYLPRGADLARALAAASANPAPLAPGSQPGPSVFRWRCDGGQAPVRLPLLADDGWRVTVDGRPAAWSASDGLVAVAASPGNHLVVARQTWLPEDVAGAAISLLSGVVAAMLAWRRRRAAPPGSGQVGAG